MTTRKRWSRADDHTIRTTSEEPAAAVAKALGRTTKSVYARRAYLKKQDAALAAPKPVAPKPVAPKPVKQLDLSNFDLFEPVTGDYYAQENPSLLRRVWRWLTRQG